MNYPSRNDDTERHPHWNQSPQNLNSDATTRADLNGIVNLRQLRQQESNPTTDVQDPIVQEQQGNDGHLQQSSYKGKRGSQLHVKDFLGTPFNGSLARRLRSAEFFRRVKDVLTKYVHFVGPGFLIAVAYIDPGNYATDVEAGASTQFRHLFIVLMSNLFAIFLQSLCIKLGSVTGLNLAENCRKHLPWWLNIILYLFAESAIIATDIAEVCITNDLSLDKIC